MRVRKLMVAVSAAVGLAGLVYSNIVTAEPNKARLYAYYSDESMTELVGEAGNGCHAGFHWGIKTAYYTYETFSCNAGYIPGT